MESEEKREAYHSCESGILIFVAQFLIESCCCCAEFKLTVAMSGRVTRQSSMLSLETEADDDEDSSDEDESFAEKLARLEKEKEETML